MLHNQILEVSIRTQIYNSQTPVLLFHAHRSMKANPGTADGSSVAKQQIDFKNI